MPAIILTWIANSLAIWVVAYFLRGVSVASFTDAIVAGAVLSLVNAFVRPILLILTLPITILTLGLFYFVVTAMCLWLTEALIPGFSVHGFLTTIVASVAIGILSAIINRILKGATTPAR